jgi:hypothetical protein
MSTRGGDELDSIVRGRGRRIAHLLMHWGTWYDFSWHEVSRYGASWCAYVATRRDGSGEPLCAPTDAGLHERVLADYVQSHPLTGVSPR